MPAQEKLIAKIQESPPDNFAELETLMQECGYGITVTDPSASDQMDEQYPEDMGPDDAATDEEDTPSEDMEVEETSSDVIPPDIQELIQAMTGKSPTSGGRDLSPGGRNKERLRVARIVIGKGDKGSK